MKITIKISIKWQIAIYKNIIVFFTDVDFVEKRLL